jgi:hypothetical protein
MPCSYQDFHMLAPGNVYDVVPESPAYHRVLWEIRKEVGALLSPVCTHASIVGLIGVVVDSLQRPVKLLFEFADHGDLTRCVEALRACSQLAWL